jgi:hypothetical protein
MSKFWQQSTGVKTILRGLHKYTSKFCQIYPKKFGSLGNSGRNIFLEVSNTAVERTICKKICGKSSSWEKSRAKALMDGHHFSNLSNKSIL